MSYGQGKWTKYKLLRKSFGLVTYLPKTRKMNKRSLYSFLKHYGKAIVKPSNSYGGAGVLLVSSKGHGKYEVHYENHIKTVKGRQAAYAYARRKTNGSSRIVQRKISLAKVNGKPFDVRIMVQKKRKSGWAVTGRLAKIAGPGYIITNTARSHGKVVPVSEAIRRSGLHSKSRRIQWQLETASMLAVKQLDRYYPINTVGMDMGIDTKAKVWIIEANFNPAKSLFLKLKNKSAFKRIMAYYRKR